MQKLIQKLGTANPNWPDDLKAEHEKLLKIINAFDEYDKDTQPIRKKINELVQLFYKNLTDLKSFSDDLLKKDSDLQEKLDLKIRTTWPAPKTQIFFGKSILTMVNNWDTKSIIEDCRLYLNEYYISLKEHSDHVARRLDTYFCKEFEKKLNTWEKSQKKDK